MCVCIVGFHYTGIVISNYIDSHTMVGPQLTNSHFSLAQIPQAQGFRFTRLRPMTFGLNSVKVLILFTHIVALPSGNTIPGQLIRRYQSMDGQPLKCTLDKHSLPLYIKRGWEDQNCLLKDLQMCKAHQRNTQKTCTQQNAV